MSIRSSSGKLLAGVVCDLCGQGRINLVWYNVGGPVPA